MSHRAREADDRFISITRGITEWLLGNSHSAINMVSVVECRELGLPSRMTVFASFFGASRKNRYVFLDLRLLKCWGFF